MYLEVRKCIISVLFVFRSHSFTFCSSFKKTVDLRLRYKYMCPLMPSRHTFWKRKQSFFLLDAFNFHFRLKKAAGGLRGLKTGTESLPYWWVFWGSAALWCYVGNSPLCVLFLKSQRLMKSGSRLCRPSLPKLSWDRRRRVPRPARALVPPWRPIRRSPRLLSTDPRWREVCGKPRARSTGSSTWGYAKLRGPWYL